MRLALQTVICCCVFTTVLPLAGGAAVDLNSSLKKRFKVWLQSRMRRDVHKSCMESQKEEGGAETLAVQPRSRRSPVTSPKKAGCGLTTCMINDLIHTMSSMSINVKKPSVPPNKMTPDGYGRRRRSLSELRAGLALRTGMLGRTRSGGASQGVRGHAIPPHTGLRHA
ncbi:pro-adrenomedullin [Polymixia lowei]